VPEPPGHPRFEPRYEPSFSADRVTLGLSGANFDHFFAAVEQHLADYPWASSEEVPGGEGIWMLPTRQAFPDIPPLYVYYRVEQNPNRIIYLGMSHAWSKLDLPPPDL
jgi:hypothetical protein